MAAVYGTPSQDPLEGEKGAPFFLGTLIGKITGDPDGLWSDYREWHITLAGAWAGAKAKTLENIPDCPEYWLDEQQYYFTPAMVVNVIKCQWPSVLVFLTGLTTKIAGLW